VTRLFKILSKHIWNSFGGFSLTSTIGDLLMVVGEGAPPLLSVLAGYCPILNELKELPLGAAGCGVVLLAC